MQKRIGVAGLVIILGAASAPALAQVKTVALKGDPSPVPSSDYKRFERPVDGRRQSEQQHMEKA